MFTQYCDANSLDRSTDIAKFFKSGGTTVSVVQQEGRD